MNWINLSRGGPNNITTMFHVVVVEGISSDLQRIAGSYLPYVSLLISAINLSTAILCIISHIEILIWRQRWRTWSIQRSQGSAFNMLWRQLNYKTLLLITQICCGISKTLLLIEMDKHIWWSKFSRWLDDNTLLDEAKIQMFVTQCYIVWLGYNRTQLLVYGKDTEEN